MRVFKLVQLLGLCVSCVIIRFVWVSGLCEFQVYVCYVFVWVSGL